MVLSTFLDAMILFFTGCSKIARRNKKPRRSKAPESVKLPYQNMLAWFSRKNQCEFSAITCWTKQIHSKRAQQYKPSVESEHFWPVIWVFNSQQTSARSAWKQIARCYFGLAPWVSHEHESSHGLPAESYSRWQCEFCGVLPVSSDRAYASVIPGQSCGADCKQW